MLSMTSTPSNDHSVCPLFVVGAGSKIFRMLDWPLPYVPVSGRLEALGEMPSFAAGSTIILFADPPTIDDALAMMISMIGSTPIDSDVHVIFISSISALFDQSDLFTGSGVYARKKKALEAFLEASLPAGNLCIVRFGNVFECGGWQDIARHCPVTLLPRGFDRCAATDIASIRACLLATVSNRNAGHINLWKDKPAAAFFTRTRHPYGLRTLYRSRLGRIAIKVAGKLLRKMGIYLPSPDDIDSFNARFFGKFAA